MSKWSIRLHNVFIRNALGTEEIAKNLVGGAGINIIGSQQDKPFGSATVFTH